MYLSLLPIKLGDNQSVPNVVHLLRVGDFKSNEYGEFKITKDHLLSFKKNFEDKVRGYNDGKLPVDYFHENHKIAAGWIEKLELANDDTELWATVKWTPKAAEMISHGELRYLSAEFDYDYVPNEGEDKSFGPTLFGAGLTNRPFVKGMENLVKFNENKGDEMTLEEMKKKNAELEAQLAAMKSEKDALSTKYSELETEKKAAEKAAADAAAKAATEKALAEKKSVFDKMLSESKAVEAQREPFMAGDMAKFAELAKPLNTKASGNEGEEDGSEQESGEKDFSDEVMALAEPIAKAKNVSLKVAISEVLRSNKELNEKYKASIKLA